MNFFVTSQVAVSCVGRVQQLWAGMNQQFESKELFESAHCWWLYWRTDPQQIPGIPCNLEKQLKCHVSTDFCNLIRHSKASCTAHTLKSLRKLLAHSSTSLTSRPFDWNLFLWNYKNCFRFILTKGWHRNRLKTRNAFNEFFVFFAFFFFLNEADRWISTAQWRCAASPPVCESHRSISYW